MISLWIWLLHSKRKWGVERERESDAGSLTKHQAWIKMSKICLHEISGYHTN